MSQTWQLFIQAPDCKAGDSLDLKDEDQHHIKNVIRRKPGEQINVVCMPESRRFLAEICLHSNKQALYVKLLKEISQVTSAPSVNILCFALCKGKKNDLVCEKATELGVQEILFWQSDRSVAVGKSEQWLDRVRKISESAAKQSKRNFIPQVTLVTELKEALDRLQPQKTLVCSLAPEATPINSLGSDLRDSNLIIGPEGDFSPQEQKAFNQYGFQLVSIGDYPLRSETAAISAIAMINALTL